MHSSHHETSPEIPDLNLNLVSLDSLESRISHKAHSALLARDIELDEKRLRKAEALVKASAANIAHIQARIHDLRTRISQRNKLLQDLEWFRLNELAPRQRDVDDIAARLRDARNSMALAPQNAADASTRLPQESERDYLVRTGKITAFGNEQGFSVNGVHVVLNLANHQNLRAPGLDSLKGSSSLESRTAVNSRDREQKRSKEVTSEEIPDAIQIGTSPQHAATSSAKNSTNGEISAELPVITEDKLDANSSESEPEYEPAGGDISSEGENDEDVSLLKETADVNEMPRRNIDDGDEEIYTKRLKNWVRDRSRQRQTSSDTDPSIPEWRRPHPEIDDAVLDDSFRLPGDIYPCLFEYQKTGVQWLYELYTQKAGGIIGDEMGLGKTVQVIAFLAGLHYLGLLQKPVLVVVPATVLNQWVNEFHRWWPPLRCVILHSIGLGMGAKNSEEQVEAMLEKSLPHDATAQESLAGLASHRNARAIVDRVMQHGHVLVTTYVGVRVYSKYVLPRQWGYVVLDEGHKIRNPDLEMALTCKQVKTHNRIILLGTPIQNNLTELWLLFDFVFPGRLGTLPVFQQEFAVPINMGGYANALNVQVQTGYQCAVVLRDLIAPYLLRRLKSDVAQDLPKKTEMVLFVRLTAFQQKMYEEFLLSQDLGAILKGKRNVLMGVDILRKICNHPDLVHRDVLMHRPNYKYGDPSKLGKLQVLRPLLQMWQLQGHKTLLFCQTRQMLDILEEFIGSMTLLDESGTMLYLRMDGQTPISKRQVLVDQFNMDPTLAVFLLTTRVGGLGVNLTGADRVIIYDPDWNPSTDMQARERAWRLGQKRDITIYRLMTTGSIEEKIYHRQIFKTLLTNKILKDPKQRRFFKLNDLHDLFTLGDQDGAGAETETSQMFGGADTQIKDAGSSDNDDDFYQVAKIMGVSKLDTFELEMLDQNGTDCSEDARIMQGIFAQGGVHSAMHHDEIIDTQRHEHVAVEREASRVARAAAETLKQSRRMLRKNAVGTPTWTGKFGGRIGARSSTPAKRGKAVVGNGPGIGRKQVSTSQSILAGLREKNSRGADDVAAKPTDAKSEMMLRLVDFLREQGDHRSSSAQLVRKCGISLKNDTVLARSMLREICEWEASSKTWRLKAEYV